MFLFSNKKGRVFFIVFCFILVGFGSGKDRGFVVQVTHKRNAQRVARARKTYGHTDGRITR